MICEKNGREYLLRVNYQEDSLLRGSINALAGEIFGGLSFEEWHRLGFWQENTVPYTPFDGARGCERLCDLV